MLRPWIPSKFGPITADPNFEPVRHHSLSQACCNT